MIPDIGLMVGAYILTRMSRMIVRWKEEHVVDALRSRLSSGP